MSRTNKINHSQIRLIADELMPTTNSTAALGVTVSHKTVATVCLILI